MDVEQAFIPNAFSSPTSSPHLFGSNSGHASSHSLGSSLDTSSASAHLERYDVPWSVAELGILRRGARPRTRSFNAILDSSILPSRHNVKFVRPLAGTSRKRLIRKIQQLTKDKADLEAQLAAIVMTGAGVPSSSREGVISQNLNVSNLASGRFKTAELLPYHSVRGHTNPFPSNVGLVGYPSTLVGPDSAATGELSSPASLENISALASRLRIALETNTVELLEEEDASLLERPGMTTLLLKRPPLPERSELYARFFAKRFIEMQKKPEDRCSALQPGPLQLAIKHPAYVSILMQSLREPVIAHMGAFDEAEFGLWVLNAVDFHSEALSESEIESGDLDDTYYEFDAELFHRFPFTGTSENVATANRWRALRGDPPLEQTSEMIAAEEYTRLCQRRAVQEAAPPTSNISIA